MRAPSAASSEKGTRNLSDATSHSAWRMLARLRRKKSVAAPIASANRLDCQRWFASSASDALIIFAGLLQRVASLFHVLQRELPGLDQVRHEWRRATAEESEQLIHHRA